MNKMNFFTKIALGAIVLPLAMTSCNKINDEEVSNNQKVELQLSSGGEVMFRSSFPSTDTQIPAGENVTVYVDEAGGATQLYGPNSLTASGDGHLTGGDVMYFPSSGKSVDIYALHTNPSLPAAVAPATVPYPTATLTHTVNADQILLANYAQSDLLYARKLAVAKPTTQPSSIPLTFYHLLSKVQVAVEPGAGLTATDITGVSIEGMQVQANFTLNKGADPNPNTNANAFAITASGPVTPIKIGTDVSTNFLPGTIQYNDAIIVPQKLYADNPFIIVHLSTNKDLIYRLPADITFVSGKKYVYWITANLSGITLTTTIYDWEAIGQPVTGDATM